MLKTPEEYPPENTPICREFAIFRTLLKSITRPLQGGGRWFEPSIAHSKKAVVLQVKCVSGGEGPGVTSGPGDLLRDAGATPRSSPFQIMALLCSIRRWPRSSSN